MKKLRSDKRTNRSDYDRYLDHFNRKDYDGVCDFYAQPMQMEIFGKRLTSREQLKQCYAFLHSRVIETIRVLDFASSETLTAVDAIVRVECFEDMTREDLDAHGFGPEFRPLARGDVLEMRQFVFYTLCDGLIEKVECTFAP